MTAFRDWLNTVFGSDGGRAVQMILALLLVVALLLTLAWLFRRVFGSGLAGGKGGRLAVVDAAHVDARRRLVLLRRDDVEHLVMIGGPNDLLVESRILRAPPVLTGQPGRMAPRPAPRPPEEESPRLAEEPAPRAAVPQRPGIGAIGAALAGAGAFVRSHTGRSGDTRPAPEAEPRSEAQPERRTVDMAFDAPLGRAASPNQPEPRAVTAASPRPDLEPPRPPVQPSSETRVEPARTDVPLVQPATPAPAPAPVRWQSIRPEPARADVPLPVHRSAPAPVITPEPPSVAPPVPTEAAASHSAPPIHVPTEDPQERIGFELERALAGLGLADEPVPPPHEVHAETRLPTRDEPQQPAPLASDTVDLLSELDLVVSEKLRVETPHEPTNAKFEPRFELHADDVAQTPSANVEPPSHEDVASFAPSVEPVGPADTARFEKAFNEGLMAPSNDAASEAPPVSIPIAATDGTAAPEVAPEPVPAKTPVDELEEEMARLLSEISGPMRR